MRFSLFNAVRGFVASSLLLSVEMVASVLRVQSDGGGEARSGSGFGDSDPSALSHQFAGLSLQSARREDGHNDAPSRRRVETDEESKNSHRAEQGCQGIYAETLMKM
ncbi:unnamed protein product [Amoebophrya sp. A25]|nr:unnamed protein product [Amoebophrya sp. A25]|eukprot:GSA25T00009674001.1